MAWKATGEEWNKFQKDLKKQGVTLNTSSKPAFVPSRQPATTPKKPAQNPVQTPNRRKGVMGILDTVKGKVKSFQDENERKRDIAQKTKYRKEAAIIKNRNRYLPQIQTIAQTHGAQVEALDTEAYVYKTVGNRTTGVHIRYGENPSTINHKLEVKFTKSATSSKIIKGITSAAHRAKEIREELSEAGTAMKGAMGDGKGNMFEDPNFGGAFNTGRSSGGSSSGRSSGTKKKRSSPQRNPDQIYPDIKW
jgi:hypothetical protein